MAGSRGPAGATLALIVVCWLSSCSFTVSSDPRWLRRLREVRAALRMRRPQQRQKQPGRVLRRHSTAAPEQGGAAHPDGLAVVRV